MAEHDPGDRGGGDPVSAPPGWSPPGPGYFGPPAGAPPPAYGTPPPPAAYNPPAAPFTSPPATPPGTFGATAVGPAATRRSTPRLGAVVGVAALTALVVGGGAGYGGARLAGGDPTAAPLPSASGSATVEPTDPTSGPPAGPAPTSLDTVAVAKAVLPGTVMIKVGDATGSGFVLDRQGRIMTNNHVVARAARGSSIKVIFSDGRRRSAKLVGRSPSYDIAVIKIKAFDQLKPVTVGDSTKTVVGQPVIAVGSPLGLPGTVTQGIVSARNRPVVVNGNSDADTPTAYIDAIQTDAPINPGNSGGPLVDAGGRVIGVNSAILTLGSGQAPSGSIGLGFAIPANQATTIGSQLIEKGKATYPVLGARLAGSPSGVKVTSVDRSGPARKAGLRAGDLVTRADGRRVTESDELIVAIRTRRPGDRVELTYSRGSRERIAKVRLGSKEG